MLGTYNKGRQMTPRPEHTSRLASEETTIKAKINEAKDTLDLIRMAHAIANLAPNNAFSG
jgi:hypothetical protein